MDVTKEEAADAIPLSGSSFYYVSVVAEIVEVSPETTAVDVDAVTRATIAVCGSSFFSFSAAADVAETASVKIQRTFL